MIRCSHCGKLAPTGALSCQNCGMPLVNSGTGVAGAGQSEQQELPAWLESLRAHERPVPSGQENRQPFSLDELVDEDSMPSWMRQDRRKAPESGNSDSLPAIPVVSAGTSPEQQNALSNGFQAGSLIDERSLPSWMRENQGQGSGQPEAAQNVSAHSLVDQQGLPAWIKDLSQAVPTPPPATNPYGLSAQQSQTPAMNQYGLSAQPQAPLMNSYGLPVQTPITPPTISNAPSVPSTPPTNESSAPPAQGFSAHDLLDVRSMPSWMSGGAQGPGQGPGSQPPTRPVPTSQGFSAGELIDQRSVPPWMRDLQGQEKSDPQSAMGVPVNGMGQTTGMGQGIQGTMSGEGMPAGSLLDRNSMPSWLRENQQSNTPAQQSTGQSMPVGSQLDMNAAMPSWMQENQLSSSAQTPPSTGQGMPARSLLDMNAMPSWLQESQLGSGIQTPQPTAQSMPANPQFDLNTTTPPWMQESQLASRQAPSPTDQGMAAGSLVDMNAMPAWMQENQLGSSAQGAPQAGQGMAAGSLIDMNAMPAWMQENQLGSSAQGAPQAGQGMAAGSLIDMNAMPAWMRNSDNAQSAPGAGGRPGQVQARPVPSRPRNEIAQQEQSEVAANVFSSMLGVAASAPALPGQEPMQAATNLGVAQGQPMPSMPPFQQAQPSLPGWQQPAMNQYNQGAQPQAWQMSGTMPPINPAPNAYAPANQAGTAPNAYASTNQAGSAGNWVQRGNTPEQPAWGGYPTADKTALGVPTSAGKNNPNPGNAQTTETKKKGFFDSIRDFFYH